jgi:predicted porin
MQRKLMAVAVAGALALPAVAVAQSSVSISGRATFEYGHVDPGTGRQSYDGSDDPGGANIRFKGMENLGGGMSAWFQCESSMDVRGDKVQDGFCTRNSAVGFKGGFGNVYAGRWDTPMKRALNQGTVGAEETGILGMSFIGFGGSGGADVNGIGDSTNRQRWKRRETNMINYDSPNLSGFSFALGYKPGGSATAALDGQANAKHRVISAGGMYTNGPLAIGLAYERHNENGTIGTAPSLDDKAWGLGVSYVIGTVTVGVNYLDAKYETGAGQDTKKATWTLGADWRLPGPHMLSIQYARADDTKGNGGNIAAGTSNGGVTGCLQGGVVNCADTGAHAWSLGYTYRFSKRTSLRLGYVRVDNDSRTNSNWVGNSKAPLNNGEDTSGYALLVKHDF